MSLKKRSKITLSALISYVVLGVSVLLIGATLFTVKVESDSAALDSANTLFREISAKTIAKIEVVSESIRMLTETSAIIFDGRKGGFLHEGAVGFYRKGHLEDIQIMRDLLLTNKFLMSVYVGYDDGSFQQLIALGGNGRIALNYKVPEQTAYIDREIVFSKENRRIQHWNYLRKDLSLISSKIDLSVDYDPITRPWYKIAKDAAACRCTRPYLFSSSGLPGITYTRSLPGGSGVLGIDVTLESLGAIMAEQRVGKSGVVWVVDQGGHLVAYPGLNWEKDLKGSMELPKANDFSSPVVREVAVHMEKNNLENETFFQDVQDVVYMINVSPMALRGEMGMTVIVASPRKDITGYIDSIALRIAAISCLILLLVIPFIVMISRRVSRSVGLLVTEAQKIQEFDFSPSPELSSSIDEVQVLSDAFRVMKSTIETKTNNLIHTQHKLEVLVEGGVALSAENDMSRLVTLIFDSAMDLAEADGGVVYLLDGDQLGVELVSMGNKSIVLGGLSDKPAPRVMVKPGITAFLSADSVLRAACEAFNTKEIKILRGRGFSLFPTGLPGESFDYPVESLISVPLLSRQNKVLGVLQLFNPGGEGGATFMEDEEAMTGFVNSLSAQAAIALDNSNLVNSLRELFDALVEVIASSIDAKSSNVAGHCRRVPEIATSLAQAVNACEDDAVRDFHMDTPEEWRQLKLAAWLHDCGKVSTPEYVVEKATKLETIFNRIHEIRTRFEVLRRDAQIEFLINSSGGKDASDEMRRALGDEYKQLEADFEFVARCNVGGEFMSSEHKERLKVIAGRTWDRHFSDFMGISKEEMSARKNDADVKLPASEHLLADKSWHLTPQGCDYSNFSDANGNAIQSPEHEYNRGELYNLSIERGTLTDEERFKINEHILNGMGMMQKIPFPENLSRVVEIATGHHETLAGTGYPMKKGKDQISTETRILAIADIFEALTASDRPYKRAKTLSETFKIMGLMCKNQHIDGDIFNIFLKERVYEGYARQYLTPGQMDVDDVSLFYYSP